MTLFAMCGCAACAGQSFESAGIPGTGPTLSGQKATVIQTVVSGDERIDVLLDSAASRWNAGSAPGTPVEVTFSFATSPPAYGTDADRRGWSAFNEEQKQVQREIMARISEVTNITFKEVPDNAQGYGQIRFHNNDQGGTSGGYAYLPETTGDLAGDVFINSAQASALTNITRGSYAYALLVHEVFHAIGLKHPGNYNAGEPAQQVPGNFLIETQDNYSNSIMSYIQFGQQGLQRDFAGPYDLLALQYLYGSKAVRPEGSTYRLADADGAYLSMIVDSGGRDTIDVSGTTVAATINLNQGASSSVGKLGSGAATVGNVQIAFGTIIENAIGTVGADAFVGNPSSNRFVTNGGSDTVDGGAGIDTVVVQATRSSAALTGGTLSLGGDTLTLNGIERVNYADALVAYDVGRFDNAGTIYRLYQAAFARTPDLGGVSFWTNAYDSGTGLDAISAGFVASAEFRSIYGASPGNSQIVGTFYQNVLNRAGEAGGVTFWVGELDRGRSIPDVLIQFAQSDENVSRLAPTLTTGILLDASAFAIA